MINFDVKQQIIRKVEMRGVNYSACQPGLFQMQTPNPRAGTVTHGVVAGPVGRVNQQPKSSFSPNQNKVFDIFYKHKKNLAVKQARSTSTDNYDLTIQTNRSNGLNFDLSEFTPVKQARERMIWPQAMLPMHLEQAPVPKSPSTAGSPTSRKRYKLVTTICDERNKEKYSLNHTEIDSEIEAVQSQCTKQMESIIQAYRPKRCLAIKPFEPEAKNRQPEQQMQMFSPKFKIRKGTKVQILKNLTHQLKNKVTSPNSTAMHATTSPRQPTTLQQKLMQKVNRNRCSTTNKASPRTRNIEIQNPDSYEAVKSINLDFNSMNSSSDVQPFPFQSSQSNTPQHSLQQMTHINGNLHNQYPMNQSQRAYTSNRGMRDRRLQNVSEVPPQPPRMLKLQVPPADAKYRKTLSPPLQTLSRAPAVAQTMMNPTILVKSGNFNVSLGQNEDQEVASINSRSEFGQDLNQQSRLPASFNSSHIVGEHKGISLKSMISSQGHRTKELNPSSLSPQMTYNLNNDLKAEIGKRSVGVGEPMINFESNNKEFRKRLSSFVIKRNQKLTNSRYSSVIESNIQEHPSTKMYFYDPSFNFQLQVMNTELLKIIQNVNSREKSIADLASKCRQAQFLDGSISPTSTVEGGNNSGLLYTASQDYNFQQSPNRHHEYEEGRERTQTQQI